MNRFERSLTFWTQSWSIRGVHKWVIITVTSLILRRIRGKSTMISTFRKSLHNRFLEKPKVITSQVPITSFMSSRMFSHLMELNQSSETTVCQLTKTIWRINIRPFSIPKWNKKSLLKIIRCILKFNSIKWDLLPQESLNPTLKSFKSAIRLSEKTNLKKRKIVLLSLLTSLFTLNSMIKITTKTLWSTNAFKNMVQSNTILRLRKF